ncbi:hypothetical protein CPAR01_01015 [Colletotrichum paranaense]|uniref:Uncharacterized protein n=1 Tax=Colletotrichum paranaense TaxID=1914294 RepID=A0ABQ9T5L3_9PEZI|nr:uncharacterized protein CPAR01_01015 [Colletotrichum paranaense]KAK1547048.1 hypothetical protein CPAR01_01015 [Colletotrichum paranaense]
MQPLTSLLHGSLNLIPLRPILPIIIVVLLPQLRRSNISPPNQPQTPTAPKITPNHLEPRIHPHNPLKPPPGPP